MQEVVRELKEGLKSEKEKSIAGEWREDYMLLCMWFYFSVGFYGRF